MTGAFSRNVGKLFSKLKLVTDNLPLQEPTEKPLKVLVVVQAQEHLLRHDTTKIEAADQVKAWERG